MQDHLEKERAAFKVSIASASEGFRDATWKKKLMHLREELDQVKRERDSNKRQCIR